MALTPANVDDRQPVPGLVQDLFGKLFADRGYLSKKLSKQLKTLFDLQLITKLGLRHLFLFFYWGGLIAYCHQPKKPALKSEQPLQVEAA